jgi:hypothetical protein
MEWTTKDQQRNNPSSDVEIDVGYSEHDVMELHQRVFIAGICKCVIISLLIIDIVIIVICIHVEASIRMIVVVEP